eukprot:PhM_4_TR10599/c0_g1_i2/m.67675
MHPHAVAVQVHVAHVRHIRKTDVVPLLEAQPLVVLAQELFIMHHGPRRHPAVAQDVLAQWLVGLEQPRRARHRLRVAGEADPDGRHARVCVDPHLPAEGLHAFHRQRACAQNDKRGPGGDREGVLIGEHNDLGVAQSHVPAEHSGVLNIISVGLGRLISVVLVVVGLLLSMFLRFFVALFFISCLTLMRTAVARHQLSQPRHDLGLPVVVLRVDGETLLDKCLCGDSWLHRRRCRARGLFLLRRVVIVLVHHKGRTAVTKVPLLQENAELLLRGGHLHAQYRDLLGQLLLVHLVAADVRRELLEHTLRLVAVLHKIGRADEVAPDASEFTRDHCVLALLCVHCKVRDCAHLRASRLAVDACHLEVMDTVLQPRPLAQVLQLKGLPVDGTALRCLQVPHDAVGAEGMATGRGHDGEVRLQQLVAQCARHLLRVLLRQGPTVLHNGEHEGALRVDGGVGVVARVVGVMNVKRCPALRTEHNRCHRHLVLVSFQWHDLETLGVLRGLGGGLLRTLLRLLHDDE